VNAFRVKKGFTLVFKLSVVCLMKSKIFISLVGIILIACFLENMEIGASEDFVVVVLKSKGRLKGLISEEDNEKIVLEMGFGTAQVLKTDIEKIEYPSEDEKKLIAKEYQDHEISVKDNVKNRDKHRREFDERIKKKIKAIEESSKKDTVISFKDSSSIFVDVVINEKIRINLLVDTGATFVVVSPGLAGKLKIYPKKAAKAISLRMADGSVITGMPVILDSVQIEDAREEKVKAVIAESGEKQGILGMSFLNKFHLNIDPEKRELTLREK